MASYRVTFSGPFGDSRAALEFPIDGKEQAMETAKKWVQDAYMDNGWLGSARCSTVSQPDRILAIFMRKNTRRKTPKRRVHAGVTHVGKGTLRWVPAYTMKKLELIEDMVALREDVEYDKELRRSRGRKAKPKSDLGSHLTLFTS
jgi:hypothetical protein